MTEKINLIYGEGEVLNGFLNLNPFLEQETDNLKRVDIKNISSYVDDGECTELISINVLEYFNSNKIPEILSHWVKKVALGGKIILGFVDLQSVARCFYNNIINLETTNILVHGSNAKPYMTKRTGLTITVVESLLKQMGLKIMKRKINNYNVTLEAVRISV
jgi:hypothetical protein